MTMCAISGVVGLPLTDSARENMLATMVRRGPDAVGSYRGDDCGLLHARLAVIDREGGRQPMALRQGAATYILVYNGELYNTGALRRELEKLGHGFTGHSDTEVVLHAFVQWREGCLERMNGIFAFALWIPEERRLFLARDRMGYAGARMRWGATGETTAVCSMPDWRSLTGRGDDSQWPCARGLPPIFLFTMGSFTIPGRSAENWKSWAMVSPATPIRR